MKNSSLDISDGIYFFTVLLIIFYDGDLIKISIEV
jgi:hypothetical protein